MGLDRSIIVSREVLRLYRAANGFLEAGDSARALMSFLMAESLDAGLLDDERNQPSLGGDAD